MSYEAKRIAAEISKASVKALAGDSTVEEAALKAAALWSEAKRLNVQSEVGRYLKAMTAALDNLGKA
jgi:hypothetical protein